MPVSQEELAARIRRGMVAARVSQQQLAEILDVDPSAVSRALSGKRNFKSLELALIAEALGTSVESLVRDGESTQTVALAARIQPEASPVFDGVVQRAYELLDFDRLLRDLGRGPLPPLSVSWDSSRSLVEQGRELAEMTRAAMQIGDEDLPVDLDDFAAFIEKRTGIDVAFEPLPAGIDGLSAACNGYRLALASSRVAATRQRYTLAHEIGHLIAGDVQDPCVEGNVQSSKTPEEKRANAFAANFLMPAGALIKSMPRGYLNENVVADLLGRFRVSLDALAFRLHNVGLVDAATRDRIRQMSSKSIALRSGRAADLQARNDRRVPGNLLNRAIDAYVDALISVRPLAALLDVDPEILLQELAPPPCQSTGGNGQDEAVAVL